MARIVGLLVGLGALAAALAIPGAEAAEARVSDVTCTNTSSGTTWQIHIDFDKATVDSYPAAISDATITWHDAKDGGNYTLDRKSGDLTMIVASSTGGYQLFHHCALKG